LSLGSKKAKHKILNRLVYFYGQAFQLLISYSPDFSFFFPDVKLTAPADAPKTQTTGTLKKLGQAPYYAYYSSRND